MAHKMSEKDRTRKSKVQQVLEIRKLLIIISEKSFVEKLGLKYEYEVFTIRMA